MLPAESCTCTVTSHVEPAVFAVVGVFEHALPVIMSIAAGPELTVVAVAEPDERVGAEAVTVQVPGAPVIVSVVVPEVVPGGTFAVAGETLQMAELSTLNDTVVVVLWNDVAAPLASRNVAVTVDDVDRPVGNSVWPNVTPTAAGAPGFVNWTFARHPVRFAALTDSVSVPSVPAAGAARLNVATPLVSVFVDGAPVGFPSSLLTVPVWVTTMVVPESVVTVWPFASWTVAVRVEVCVEPATMLAGLTEQLSFAGGPTAMGEGTVICQ